MWTSSQFVDWLSTQDLDELLPPQPRQQPDSDTSATGPQASASAEALHDATSPRVACTSMDDAESSSCATHSAGSDAPGSSGRKCAERAWTGVQERMKQQVLYTLACAADAMDHRPRSFELYGCAPRLSLVDVASWCGTRAVDDACAVWC